MMISHTQDPTIDLKLSTRLQHEHRIIFELKEEVWVVALPALCGL